MTNSLPWYRWPIEMKWFTQLTNGGSFHGKMLNNQMVIPSLKKWGWNGNGHNIHEISEIYSDVT